MKQWLQNLLAETSPLGRVAFRISMLMLGASIGAFALYTFVYFEYAVWQVSALQNLSIILGLVSIYAAVIAWDSRHRASMEFLITGTGIILLITVSWFQGIGLVMGLGLAIFAITVAGETMTRTETPRAVGVGVLFGIAIYLLDLFANWERLSIPIVATVLPIIVVFIIVFQSIQVVRQFPRYSIRTKFVTVLSTIALISIGSVGYISNQIFSNLSTRVLNEDLKIIASSAAKEVELVLAQNLDRLTILALNRFIQDSVDEANLTATNNQVVLAVRDDQWSNASNLSPLVQGVLDNEVSGELREFQARYPKIVEIFITDKYGAIIASTIKTSDYYQADEEWWQRAWNDGNGSLYISQPTYDENTKAYAIEVSIPIPGHNRSDLVGVIRSTVDISELGILLNEGRFGETGHSDLYFGDNQYLSDNPAEGLLTYSEGVIQQVILSEQDFSEVLYEGNLSVARAIQVTSNLETSSQTIKELNWYIVSHQDVSETLAPVQATTRTITLISITLLFGVVLFSLFLANQFIRPLENLTSAANELSQGKIQTKVKVQSEDEFGALAATFNLMAERLQDLIGTLEQRVEERTNALATSAEVSRRLSTIMDRKELVKEVVEQLKSSFNYYHAHIYLLDEKTNELVMAGGTGAAGETLLQRGHKLAYGQGLVGRAAASKQPVIVPDTSADSAWLPNPLLPETRAEIAVPIKTGEQILGVLDVQNNTVNSLSEQDAELIGSIASQFAIALLNTQSTEKVRAAQEQFALAVEGSNDGIWDWDVETNVVYYSPRWKEMVGYGEDELNNGFADFEALLHPEDHDRVLNAVGEYLNGKSKEYNLQFRFRHKDGTYRWIQAKGKALRRENGAPYRMAGSHTDITESVIEQNAIAANARQQAALNLITQRIQNTTSIESALQVAARELGHALGMKPTAVSLQPLNEQTRK